MIDFKNTNTWPIWRPVKFLIVGSTSAGVSLLTIFILVGGLGIWPVWGTIGASLTSGTVGFIFHKIWTFNNKSPEWLRQAVFYFSLVGLNLIVSTVAMYILNDIFHIFYFLDQIVILLGLAIFNYFINRTFIFR